LEWSCGKIKAKRNDYLRKAEWTYSERKKGVRRKEIGRVKKNIQRTINKNECRKSINGQSR
jgi:hypothetical protein